MAALPVPIKMVQQKNSLNWWDGLTTKVDAAIDALGNSVRLIITAGQASGYEQASALIEGFSTNYVLADKGYAPDAFIFSICSTGAKLVIPQRQGRLPPRDYGRELYKERNLVERLFRTLKHSLGVATRYERLGHNYLTYFS